MTGTGQRVSNIGTFRKLTIRWAATTGGNAYVEQEYFAIGWLSECDVAAWVRRHVLTARSAATDDCGQLNCRSLRAGCSSIVGAKGGRSDRFKNRLEALPDLRSREENRCRRRGFGWMGGSFFWWHTWRSNGIR